MKDSPQSSRHVLAQQDRFDSQGAKYSQQHGHPMSQAYRDRFIRARVLDDVLDGAVVLDAMCGGGEETGHMLDRAAHVEGLDISPEFAVAYESRWGVPCTCASISESGLAAERFDVVYVCGGLHHVHPLLEQAIDECWRVLKTGGYLVVVEPNADAWTDRLRRLWYRLDKRFAEGEAAISVRRHLQPLTVGKFETEVIHFGGGAAYVLVAQAFIVRTPAWFRERLGRALFAIEGALERTPLNPRLFVCVRYRKIAPAAPDAGGEG